MTTEHRHNWAPINAREQECLDCDATRDIPESRDDDDTQLSQPPDKIPA